MLGIDQYHMLLGSLVRQRPHTQQLVEVDVAGHLCHQIVVVAQQPGFVDHHRVVQAKTLGQRNGLAHHHRLAFVIRQPFRAAIGREFGRLIRPNQW